MINRTMCLTALWALCSWAVTPLQAEAVFPDSSATVVVTSDYDQRQYEYLELENSLRVLLVSDPEADKAAAALDVHVGHFSDPKDREGLAHFLEHMLFLGTEKYPQPDEYQQFIASHGGSHNAFTSGEHTNYFFDVEASHLETALDRFAQFFTAPLFNPQYVERERNAVHSEFRARYRNDYRRRMDVIGDIVNPEHPYSKFSVGNLETLADRENDPVREDLLAFYATHYSAHNMALVVLGRESLQDLRAMVVSRFQQIPNNPVVEPPQGIRLMEEGALPALVEIQPVKTIRRLSLSFPMPLGHHYRKKPTQYLGGILGHEGEGSLLSLLKQQGWAEGLSAGGHGSGANQETFDITISLTEDGVVHRAEVVAAVFAMVDRVRQSGVDRWRFREQQTLSQLAFKFAEKQEAIHTVSRLANNMHDYPAADILRGPYALDEYDAALIEQYLAALTPKNVLQVLEAPGISADTQSDIYQTPYRYQRLSDIGTSNGSTSLPNPLLAQLELPGKNRFIPKRLSIKPAGVDGVPPQKLVDKPSMQMWYGAAAEFPVPRGDVNIRVYSPAASMDVASAAMMHLYAALVNDALNEFAYPAQLAGLAFSIQANSRGLDISIGGYDDRQRLLLKRILSGLMQREFQQQRFDNLRAELVRSWNNDAQQTPYQQLYRTLPVLLYSPLWSRQALAEALSNVTPEQLSLFADSIYRNSEIQMLVFGNYTSKEAARLASMVERRLHSSDRDPAPVRPAQVVVLPKGVERFHLPVDHQDSAAIFYLQAPSDSVADRAAMLMLKQMLAADFFNELRTEKQLGYIVFMSDLELKDTVGSVFVVQSPSATVDQLRAEIGSFIEANQGQVKDFELHQSALLSRLQEEPKNLSEQADRYWSEIVAGNDSFQRRQQLINAVSQLTANGLSQYSASVLGSPAAVLLTADADSASSESASSIAARPNFQEFKSGAKVRTYP